MNAALMNATTWNARLPFDDPSSLWVADAHGLATEDLDSVVDALIAELAGEIHDAIVIEQVVVACQELSAAGVLAGLATATESMARARLRAVVSPGTPNEPT